MDIELTDAQRQLIWQGLYTTLTEYRTMLAKCPALAGPLLVEIGNTSYLMSLFNGAGPVRVEVRR